MNFFDLDTEFESGKYEGMTLEEVFQKDPKFVEQCLLKMEDFNISDDVMEELKAIDDEFEFSAESLQKRDEKFQQWEQEQDEDDDDYYNNDPDLEEFMAFNGEEDEPLEDEDFDEFDDLGSDMDDDYMGGSYNYDDDDY
jgi:hypothetical protein